MDWQELSATSHYQTALEIEQELEKGNVQAASTGLKELIEALGRSEKRALKGHLTHLMAHIIKWKTQADKRSRSWAATIYNAREEIKDIQEETPSLTNKIIEEMWKKSFQAAKREAEANMNQDTSVSELSWEEVFEEAYSWVSRRTMYLRASCRTSSSSSSRSSRLRCAILFHYLERRETRQVQKLNGCWGGSPKVGKTLSSPPQRAF
jgi:Domain of unknown function DUF29